VLRTVDTDPQGDGRFYFRRLKRSELGPRSTVRLEVRVRVLRSEGNPASTGVQLSLQDRRLGLGFLTHGPGSEDDEVLLLDAGGARVLGLYRLPVNVLRTYRLEVLRGEAGPEDDRVRLSVVGSELEPLSVRVAELLPVQGGAYDGLLFGHPVGGGTGEAEWESLAMTIQSDHQVVGPLEIGTRHQLFLDDEVIDRMEGLQRVQGEPVKHPGNPVLRRDKPWEAARCELYGSAVWDPERQRIQLFYAAMLRPYEIRMAYAESADGGAQWVKPEFDLFPFEGQPTNIVWPGRYAPHGPSVIRDEHDPDPARRYKLFTADYPALSDMEEIRAQGGMDVAFSPDGIHWTPSPNNPVLPGFISDTAQCVLWDPALEKYVAYVRMWVDGRRSVGRTESADFETWTPPEVVYTPGPEDVARGWQFYSLSATLYQGIYVGLVWIFPAVAASGDWTADTPVTWPELVVSRDGFDWERVAFGEPFLPLGPAGSFDHRQIRLASSLVVLEDRILLFYAGSPHPHVKEHHYDIGLATLRLDGFVSLTAGGDEGILLTQPLRFEAGTLRINATVQPGGSVKAELLDAAGQPRPGYGADRCQAFQGDSLDGALTWTGQDAAPAASPDGTRIRFRLKNAKLYSFWIEPSSSSCASGQTVL